ncbi:MAG TPA: hypothetical protein VE988_28390, partial [Gemmataceae bacterium]|nr:hypothetical protein [Gemmataceae bacterium]
FVQHRRHRLELSPDPSYNECILHTAVIAQNLQLGQGQIVQVIFAQALRQPRMARIIFGWTDRVKVILSIRVKDIDPAGQLTWR